MKSGKEVKLNSSNKNFKIKSGAVENYKTPYSVYVNMSSWVTLKKKVDDPDKLFKGYRSKIKFLLKNHLLKLEHFEYENMVDFDISITGIKNFTPTYLSLELNLFQKDLENPLPLVKSKNSKSNELKGIIENICNDILEMEFFNEDNEYLEFNLTKE